MAPTNKPPIDFGRIAAAALQQADTLVERWLPGGKRVGHEWQCGSLSGDAGSSCSVNLNTGAWADFATDEAGGDLISLFAAIQQNTMTVPVASSIIFCGSTGALQAPLRARKVR